MNSSNFKQTIIIVDINNDGSSKTKHIRAFACNYRHGFENESISTTEGLFTFLYTAMACNMSCSRMDKEIDKILNWFGEDGITLIHTSYYPDNSNKIAFSVEKYYGISKAKNLKNFVNFCLKSKENLYNFLFGSRSRVYIGNDFILPKVEENNSDLTIFTNLGI